MNFSTSTKPLLLWVGTLGLLLSSPALNAQNNQVISSPASTTPGTLNTIIRLNYGVNQSQEDALTGTENILIGNAAGAAYRGTTNRSTIVGSRAGAYTFRSQLTTTQDNTLFGAAAGQVLVGSYNTFTGSGAGAMVPPGQGAPVNSGNYNTFNGYQAGYANQFGSNNTYMGSNVGYSTTNGYSNVAIGVSSFYANQTGHNNVMVGDSAGFNNTVSDEVFVGSKAGYSNTTGASNTFLGRQSGYFNQAGSYNAFVGFQTGFFNTTGSDNSFVGFLAGSNNTTGNDNSFVGFQAGNKNTTGSSNTFMGYQAGYASTGSANTFLGYQAGQNNQSGGNNVFIGYLAGLNNTSGLGNLFLGQQAGASNTVGNYNLFMGNSTGQNTSTGNGNTAIGDGAFYGNSTGGGNTAIGRYAGYYMSTGVNNTFIGLSAGPANGSGAITNATAIGYNAQVTASNSLILGSGANVGIGNSAPTAKLHLTADGDNSSGLRLEKLTSASPATGGQSKFLTVDGSGNVILGTSGSGRSITNEQWTANGTTLQNANGGAVVIGPGVSALPAGYQLYVEQGILTERVKVAVKNTSEWSDYVFAPTYNLLSLSQVEAHIQQTGHLPGVPSAQQMVEQGNDLHKTDAKLLEKIEELTLYSIQLEKANEQLRQNDKKQQAEIEELKQLMKKVLNKK